MPAKTVVVCDSSRAASVDISEWPAANNSILIFGEEWKNNPRIQLLISVQEEESYTVGEKEKQIIVSEAKHESKGGDGLETG